MIPTEIGRVGMLICSENTNPLARYALMAQGEQVHISTYPPAWPTRPPGESAAYDLARAIEIRAGAHAFEAKVFNIVCSAVLDGAAKAVLCDGDAALADIVERTPAGVSMVLDPTGSHVTKPHQGNETIIYADIEVAACVEPKQFHDVVGYYNRFDIFRLTVDRTPREPISFEARGGHSTGHAADPADGPGTFGSDAGSTHPGHADGAPAHPLRRAGNGRIQGTATPMKGDAACFHPTR